MRALVLSRAFPIHGILVQARLRCVGMAVAINSQAHWIIGKSWFGTEATLALILWICRPHSGAVHNHVVQVHSHQTGTSIQRCCGFITMHNKPVHFSGCRTHSKVTPRRLKNRLAAYSLSAAALASAASTTAVSTVLMPQYQIQALPSH